MKPIAPLTASHFRLAAAWLGAAATAFGGTVTFSPNGPSVVPSGTPISFDVTVSADAPGGFNTADIVIGADTATNISFVYSVSWFSAFANVTPVTYDNGLYSQDVFVGGNNPASVGTSVMLGTVVVETVGMNEGFHQIKVDFAIDGASTLGLAGVPEPVAGMGTFEITPPVPTMSEWGVGILGLSIIVAGTLLVGRISTGGATDLLARG